MLYIYNGKIYIKPFENKIVEVIITKDGDEYNVKTTDTVIEVERTEVMKMVSTTVEEAYKMQNKRTMNFQK